MSLGILNNIAALYAENNLNSTQANLQNYPSAALFRFTHQLRRG